MPKIAVRKIRISYADLLTVRKKAVNVLRAAYDVHRHSEGYELPDVSEAFEACNLIKKALDRGDKPLDVWHYTFRPSVPTQAVKTAEMFQNDKMFQYMPYEDYVRSLHSDLVLLLNRTGDGRLMVEPLPRRAYP